MFVLDRLVQHAHKIWLIKYSMHHKSAILNLIFKLADTQQTYTLFSNIFLRFDFAFHDILRAFENYFWLQPFLKINQEYIDIDTWPELTSLESLYCFFFIHSHFISSSLRLLIFVSNILHFLMCWKLQMDWKLLAQTFIVPCQCSSMRYFVH